MRPTRTLFLLVPILVSCGSVQIILKPPIQKQCDSTGLKGCPELTDGTLLYVQGDKVKGKEALIKAAAQNAPDKLKKFAQALKELDMIPGVMGYMMQVMEVADILASAPGGGDQAGAPRPKRRRRGGARPEDLDVLFATADVDGPREGGIVAPSISSDRGSCGGLGGYAVCVWAATGPLVVTELATSPGCPVGLIAGASKTAALIDAPRWVARNPPGLGGARVFVRDGESLFVGVQTNTGGDTHCALSWAGFRPWDD
jgi:hypothetical protein